MSNKERYKREIKDLRDLLNDNEYTRTLPTGYHQFLSEMHRKLVSDFKITPKMLDAIQTAAATYRTYGDPEITSVTTPLTLITFEIKLSLLKLILKL